MLFGRPLSERRTAHLTQASVLSGLFAALCVLAIMLLTGSRHVGLEVGDWVLLPDERYDFHLKFVFDRLSVPFLVLTYLLVGTTGAFASRYLHREAGFNRFFLQYALFLLGMVLAALAGTIETLFLGWELVGLSSALLVAYFHKRENPVANGQRVWSIYRLADAAFLIAAVVVHHMSGRGDFDAMIGAGPWPEGEAVLASHHALIVGLLLLIAVAGRSALIPFSGWLPRAMEGPTPSSAIFYGALSVHLGVYLLLRVSPILACSMLLSGIVVAVGLATAIIGSLSARVQADVKSGLAFASMTQVGLITTEIGLGLRYLALIHIIGHACLRALQLLRAPSLLHDYHKLEDAIGDHLPPEVSKTGWLEASRWSRELYWFAYRRGNFDALLDRFIVQPLLALFHGCERLERRWLQVLEGSGTQSEGKRPT